MASGKDGTSLIEKRVEEQVLRALQEKEAALDAALQQQQQQQQQRQGGDSDDELERIRQQRRRQLQQRMQHLQDGYGVITEIHDEKEFFALAKKCPLLAVLVKEGQTEHSIVGLDEIGGNNFNLTALEETLRRHRMLPPE